MSHGHHSYYFAPVSRNMTGPASLVKTASPRCKPLVCLAHQCGIKFRPQIGNTCPTCNFSHDVTYLPFLLLLHFPPSFSFCSPRSYDDIDVHFEDSEEQQPKKQKRSASSFTVAGSAISPRAPPSAASETSASAPSLGQSQAVAKR
jgi:hypothetical protein